jgi:hypothetical protein
MFARTLPKPRKMRKGRVVAFAAMRALLIPLAVAACGKDSPPPATPASSGSVGSSNGSVSSDDPGPPPAPIIDQTAPPVATSRPDDHEASATAIYDATNYVAPAELAYSRKLDAVVYPACGGGEGPGEHCGLAAYGRDGKDKKIADDVQVTWFRMNHDKDDKRTQTIAKLKASLDKLDTFRMDRAAWRGDQPIQLAGFGTVEWKPKDKTLVVTREGKTVSRPTKSAEGGPVNVFWSKDAPLAIAQLRFNPASGGREGYVVFVELVVLPRP